MKFTKEKVSTLMGGTEVWYTQSRDDQGDEKLDPYRFMVTASGVAIAGDFAGEIASLADLEVYGQTACDAFAEHSKMRKALQNKILGKNH